MENYGVRTRQFTSSLIAVLTVDGAAVGASYASTGLDNGQHIAEVKKVGSTFTFKFRRPMGLVPQAIAQPITVDCVVRPSGTWTRDELEFTTYTLAGAGGAGTEDFTVLVFGTEGVIEGGR